jgi:peptidyl-prolyl cis-trans isomerase D
MFDLFRSRDKLVRIMLGAILLVVAASMVTYLIPNSGFNTTGTDDTVLAEVAGQKLTQREFQQRFAIVMQNMQGATPQMAPVILPQFLDSVIQQMAALHLASKLGITVSDDEVLAGIMSRYQQFFPNGTVNKDQFEQYLASQGMTIEEISNEVRDQLIFVRLQDAVLEGIVVTPAEVEAEFARRYDKAKISYIAFPATKFFDQVKPTDEELRKVYEASRSDAEYRVPAKTSYQIVVLQQDKVAATLTVSDAQLHAEYSKSMDNFRMPERIHVRHILVSTQGKSDAEKKALKTKADDILKQLKNGADFAELAKKDSDDKGSGEKGSALDWIVKGQMDPQFEAAAFALKPKELSPGVTTTFGYHIIQVLEKEPAHVKPFDEVKAGLADELKKQNLTDKMQMLGDEIRAALAKSPGSAAEVAKQYGADLVSVPEGAPGQPIPGLGASPEIDSTLADMKPNDVSPVLVLPGDRLAVVVLKARIPARTSNFDEVKDQIRQKFVQEKAQLLADTEAKQALEQLRAGEDMEKVAKSLKLDVVTSSFFGRSDSVEGLGQALYVEDAFTKPTGTVFGPTMINGRDVVSKVLEKIPADPSALSAQRDQILLELKQKKAQERAELMLDSITAELTRQGKLKRNTKAIQALSASYSR